MKVYIDPSRAPLANVPTSLRPREVQRLAADAAKLGIVLTGEHGVDEHTGASWIGIDISQMNQHAPIQQARAALVSWLNDTMNADRVDCESRDVLALTGRAQHDAMSYNMGASIRDGSPDFAYLLTEITPDELFSEALPEAMDLAFDPTGGIRPEQTAEEQELRAQVNAAHTQEAMQQGVIDIGLADHADLWESYESRLQHEPQDETLWDTSDAIPGYKDPFNSGGF